MNKLYQLCGVCVLAGTLISCNTKTVTRTSRTAAKVETEKKMEEKEKKITEFDVSNMDLKVSPASDFYNYANGGWMARTEIPSDEGRWGSFNELRDINDDMTLTLVDKALALKNVDPTTDQGKVITFFNTAMNTEKRNAQGIAPIQPYLDAIDAIENTADIVAFTNKMEPIMGGLFGMGVHSDLKNSNFNALYLGTGVIGLPERSYYVDEDEDSEKKRAKYLDHIARMFSFIGYNATDAAAVAKSILGTETTLAKAMLTKEERRNPEKTYNPMSIMELNKLVPAVNWADYITGLGAKTDRVIVSQPEYMKQVQTLLSSNDIDQIKDYLRWVVLNDAAGSLTEEMNEANFDFYGRYLRDLQEQKPLKERVLKMTNGVLTEALGQVYVAEYFPPEAKQSAVDMVENIRRAYKQRITNLDWMSDETKEKAITKLMGMTVKIGYPDKWKDYSDLTIGDSHFDNLLNARKWRYNEKISKVGEEVDKSEWFMGPQTVNAYYNPVYNEIVFPAAILQPPFFDYTADAAINYGGMGAVIGHEISHGFDDQGAKFDVEGNMNNWWTPEDEENFKERGDKLVAQFDKYEALPEVFVNGRFTLGENIGDLGGVNSAYDGLQLYLKENGNPGLIDGMTPEQRFFVNWATIWRTKFRDEALRNQIKTDPHSPGQFRATGPLVNVDAFYEAFDIDSSDDMYVPDEERVKIW